MNRGMWTLLMGVVLFATASACGGDEFTQSEEAESGGSGGTTSSGGTGGKASGGTGGTSGTGGSNPVTGGTGATSGTGGMAANAGAAGAGGDSGSAGQGGSEPTPACEGTAFSTSPPNPKADEPFIVSLSLVGGGDYVCAELTMQCPPTGELAMNVACSDQGCQGGGTRTCDPGVAYVAFVKRKMDPLDVCCDGDPNTPCHSGPIAVTEEGTIVAECTFTVQP